MPGLVVILNGVPRSGKSSIARAMQRTLSQSWLNFGVDAMMQHVLPQSQLPGLGLRPGGERPDLEAEVERQFLGLYAAVASLAEQGCSVVVDAGHHDGYSRSLNLLPRCCAQIAHLPTLLVGLYCPIEEILRRRRQSSTEYESAAPGEPVPAPVQRWQDAVHVPGRYDLTLDTGQQSPTACAAAIERALADVKPGTGMVAELAG